MNQITYHDITNKVKEDFNVIATNDIKNNPERLQDARGRGVVLLEAAVLIIITPVGILGAALLSEALVLLIPVVCGIVGTFFVGFYFTSLCFAIEDDKDIKAKQEFSDNYVKLPEVQQRYNEFFDDLPTDEEVFKKECNIYVQENKQTFKEIPNLNDLVEKYLE